MRVFLAKSFKCSQKRLHNYTPHKDTQPLMSTPQNLPLLAELDFIKHAPHYSKTVGATILEIKIESHQAKQ